jgi:hypothetical protein
VLAHYRIKFLDVHLLRHRSLVLGRCVEVPCSGTGNQLDFVTHYSVSRPLLNFFATLAHIGKNCIDSYLVDDSHAFSGKSQPYPAIFAFHPETVVMQVGKEATLRPVLSV